MKIRSFIKFATNFPEPDSQFFQIKKVKKKVIKEVSSHSFEMRMWSRIIGDRKSATEKIVLKEGGGGRYVYGEIRRQGIRAGNIIIRRVKKLKGREKEGDKGKRWETAREKGEDRGKGWDGRGFILRYGWNPKCSEGALSSCVVPRQHHSGIPRYRCVSVISLCVRVRIRVQERIS